MFPWSSTREKRCCCPYSIFLFSLACMTRRWNSVALYHCGDNALWGRGERMADKLISLLVMQRFVLRFYSDIKRVMRHTACHFRKKRFCGIGRFRCSVLCAVAHRFTKRISPTLRMLRHAATLRHFYCNLLLHYGLWRRLSREFPPPPLVKMQSLFKCILPFLFMISAIALSIPSSLSLTTPKPETLSPPLSLINLNSTGLNPSNLTSTVMRCNKILGQDLNIGSCRNAWEKIHPTQHVQRFWPRLNQFHHYDIRPEDVLTPFRYLSDDGLCAIVRCPLFTSTLLFYCYSICARSNKWPQKIHIEE